MFCSFSKKLGFSTFFHLLLICLVLGFYSQIFPCPVPQWLAFIDPPHHYSPRSPKRNNWQFSFFLITKKYVIPIICLFFIQILSILCNFVISNHENHTIFKKRNQRKFFSMDFNFKLTSNLKQILPEIPQTQNSGNRCYFLWSPRNDKLPFPNSPKLQGKKI